MVVKTLFYVETVQVAWDGKQNLSMNLLVDWVPCFWKMPYVQQGFHLL